MNDEMIKKIADAIANKTILSSWLSYCILITLTFIGGYFGSFLSGYSRKRGEQLATKADLDDIKLQIKTTTEITEKIRNVIAHEVWRKQQHETVKRQKLEEYLTLIYIIKEDLSKEMNNRFFYCEDQIDVHAESKATMLMKLYLPEIREAHSEFLLKHADFKQWLVDGMKQQMAKRKTGETKPLVDDELTDKYSDLLKGLNLATLLIEETASQLAEKLMAQSLDS